MVVCPRQVLRNNSVSSSMRWRAMWLDVSFWVVNVVVTGIVVVDNRQLHSRFKAIEGLLRPCPAHRDTENNCLRWETLRGKTRVVITDSAHSLKWNVRRNNPICPRRPKTRAPLLYTSRDSRCQAAWTARQIQPMRRVRTDIECLSKETRLPG
jgi:hypothetical protein